jgi:putative hydrolase of the HAD superfamily
MPALSALPKAVLFDLDDTLFDRSRAQKEILRIILSRFSDLFSGVEQGEALDAFFESDRLAIQSEEYGAALEVVRDTRSRTFLELLGLGTDRAQEVTAAYVASYGKISAPMNGAIAAVRALHGRFTLGLVSNGYPDVQYAKIDSLGIRDLLECALLSGEVGIRKPAREIFLRAAESVGAEPGECLFVGDSYGNDVIGAKGAGMQACWLNRSGVMTQGATAPDMEISRLEQLLDALAVR